jgi:hypothetical protein
MRNNQTNSMGSTEQTVSRETKRAMRVLILKLEIQKFDANKIEKTMAQIARAVRNV